MSPVLSNRVAKRLDDEPGDAEIPNGRDPNIADRTNDNARPAATIGQSRLLRRSHSPASQAPANHPPSAGVNPDASLSCRAPGSDAPAQHGRAVPAGCFDSAGRPHAARGAGHDQRNRRRNRSVRDRSSCRSAPGCDTPCKQTAGPARHHRGRIDKHPVDERHVGRDTRLACVPGTMCGTASSLTAKFNIGAVPAFRLKQAFTRCPTNRQPVAQRHHHPTHHHHPSVAAGRPADPMSPNLGVSRQPPTVALCGALWPLRNSGRAAANAPHPLTPTISAHATPV
jgi:hypothetical protein